MRYDQKKNGNKISFVLNRENLSYSLSDKQHNIAFKVEYEQIPMESFTVREMNTWLRNVGLLWLVLGAVFTVIDYMAGELRPSIWLFVGAGCYVTFLIRQTEFIYFDTNKGRILIINDAQGQEIHDMIQQRRVTQIRERYGQINWNNDPEQEVRRFRWMEENGVISESEYNEIEAKIRLRLPDGEKPFELN